MERFRISIGDWSQDGHNQFDQFVFQSNKTVEEMQEGYKNSCKLTGVQFNINANFIAKDPAQIDRVPGRCLIFCEYQDSTISRENLKALTDAGIDFQKYSDEDLQLGEDIQNKSWQGDQCYCDIRPEKLAYLILDFIKLSIPDLEYEEAFYKFSELKSIPPLNGWWCKGLNHQFGYGLYN